MKRMYLIAIIAFASVHARAQSQEAQQLLLDWEKLTQFKTILKDMYKGWTIVNNGYTSIKSIAKGNFNLHKGFLDALLQVSPEVRHYKRIADIINYQLLIVKQYKKALQNFKDDNVFTLQEINYLEKVYSNLLDESIKNLDELVMVITAGKLRMSDDERLKAIDRIYDQIEDQFSFLQDFNTSTSYLSAQRKSEQADVNMSRRIYGH